MKLKKQNMNVSSSLENKRKIHQKINDHIKGIIRQNKSVLSQERNMNAQKIPEKIIFKTKQTHKYLYKKSLINNKFQWLNKYIENSELQSLSINIQPSNLIKNQKQENSDNKQNVENYVYDKKLTFNRRSRTQAAHENDDQTQFYLCNKDKNFFAERKSEPEHQLKHLQQITFNNKITSEKIFTLNRSKSLKDRKNIFDVANDQLKQNILRQKNVGVSNRSNLMQKNFSISNDTEGKQNKRSHQSKNNKNMKIFIDENTPAKQFLQFTARLNSSNLMFKNTSGYIKNRKRQYIYQSREEKRQQSELLKLKRRFQEQITVQPWNPNGNGNQNENEENDFLMQNHQ